METIGGAAGDMIIGAFLAAGMPLEELSSVIRRLQLKDVRLASERVERAGVRATKLDVLLGLPADRGHTHRGHGDGPTLAEIGTRLSLSGLPYPVVDTSLQIFRC